MVLDAVANFVRGNTDAAVDSSQTTVSVTDASIFPDPATEGEYNVVIWDATNFPRPDQDGDVEILRVTAIDATNNDLTVVRGQETTTAAAHPSGSAIHLSPTAKMFSDIESTFGDIWDADTQELTADVNNQSVSTEDGTIGEGDGGPIVGKGWAETQSGTGFHGGSYNTNLYDADPGLTLAVRSGNSVTGPNALEIDHEGSGGRQDCYLQYGNPTTQNKTESFVAANHTFSTTFRIVNSVSEAFIRLAQYDNTTKLVNIDCTPGATLQTYDGDAGSYVDTGASIAAGDAISLRISIDYDNNVYDVYYDVGGATGSETDLGFQIDADYLTYINFQSNSGSAQTVFAVDQWNIDRPIWWVFGDSITRGTGYGTLASDGTDSFTYQLNKRSESNDYLWVRNTDGGGSNGLALWGSELLEQYAEDFTGSRVLLAFGQKEVVREGYTKGAFLNHYMSAVSKAQSLGLEPYGWLMTRRDDVALSKQREWVRDLQTLFETYNIPYVNAWDALDSSPNDGNFDGQDSSLFADGVHPTPSGHDELTDKIINDIGL